MRKLLLLFLGVLLAIGQTYAQNSTVSGRVTDSDGSPIPGVTVAVKGGTTGTTTDNTGTYTLSVSPSATLVFSFVGFESREVAVGNQSVINVTLRAGINELNEVVVTAQGIERDRRSLGYAVQSISGDAISQRSEPNLLNTLQGKLAGVNIGSSSGAAGASTNINIRGITSFNGNNQPLIVVDGIIFNNNTDNTQNTLFGSQPANRLSDIAPETIESINILKGPAAAVLYGSRASAGAIVITTKSGRTLKGKTEVTVNSSYNVQEATGLPSLQNDYGQGVNNGYVPTSTNSWGPRFGTPGFETVTNVQGETVPYQAYPNHFEEFYRTGTILQNGVSIASGNIDDNYIATVNSMFQNGVIPNSEFNRHSVSVGGNKKLTNGVRAGGSITYVRSKQQNTTMGNGGSAFGQLTRIPRSFDFSGRPFQNELGRSIYYSLTQNHPLWSVNNEFLNSNVDRVFGNLKVGYDITNWLNVTYRVTADTYLDRRKLTLRIGSARAPQGELLQDATFNSELNGDLLVTAQKSNLFLEGLDATLLLGQNLNQRDYQNSTLRAASLTIPGFDNVSNGSVFTGSDEELTRRRLIGHYGQLSLGYNQYLFLELSGRVDQSSTLPKGNNTYFYPSVAVSFVPTDAFKIESDVLSYTKVRASAARVGRDADPYLLQSVYVASTFGNNLASVTFPLSVGGASVPGFNPSGRIGSTALTPEFVTSYEVGLNVGLFRNRFGLDLAYFDTRSTNQIFNVAVSNSSGFDTRTTNIGEMTNKGVEAVLTATVVRAAGFKWDIAANYTRIRNTVVSIAPGVENSTITGNSFIGIAPSIKEGEPYGVIIGSKNQRNENGELLINPATGTFLPATPNEVIARILPDWTGGITNTFNYKGINLSVLFDTRQGGQLYSFGMVDLRSGGHIDYTGVDRELPRVLPGVITNADGTFTPNNIQIPAQTYWAALGGLASEGAVFDATVYRLREIALNYSLPANLLKNTPFGGATIGISGRNLWFFAPGFPGDPEVNTQGAGNIQGFDLNGAPQTKNYGVNLRFTF
ncbi:SusC/RagA family TonB-linked outer membrane protein [Telluribacter sp.]|jgi:TonB-linked SusC/RagA family outer membrane protein|uniref:SusC/RagA family TonB-linked outer membrane protein n=1 Tax=Telluribacter sp. TaxID=1978767 RepID=UPI002E0FA375|nr:SusC/RagA family TonB-linked outer membrane protein [Telluribacter sp.]